MRRFLRDIELRMMDFPDEHKQFQCLLSVTATQTGIHGEMLKEEQSEAIVPLLPVKRIALQRLSVTHALQRFFAISKK